MGLINAIKEWLLKLLTKNDIKRIYGSSVAISDKMQTTVTNWLNMYMGNASWLDNEIGVQSLRLEQAITREFANTVLNEMTVSISNAKLQDVFNSATEKLNINLQRGLATGAMVIKPLGADKVQFVSQDSFVPVEYDATGRLIKVIFPEVKRISESTWLTRLEYHSLDYDKGLTITNRAFTSNSETELGREISLESVDEWSQLPPTVTYPTMLRPAFGYFICPFDNTIDGTHAGVSIFNSAIESIKRADVQFGRLDWEFESAERAVDVEITALQSIDGKVLKMPQSKKRLYRGLNIDGGQGDFYKEFSPTLRQADFIAGLEEYKRDIEFAVGLSYGDISNPQTVAKTATEIKSSKQRKYDTVNAIQTNLRECLIDLCFALAFYNSLTTSNYEFVCNFKDSILTDEETERKQDLQDISVGAMQLWEYRMKWYSEDEATAKKMIPQQASVIE